jgi:lysine 2,3-aminomutase
MAPSVKEGQYFLYFDPIHSLPAEGQARWADVTQHEKIVEEALELARANQARLAP